MRLRCVVQCSNGFPGWQDLYLLEPRAVQPFGTPVSYWMPVA